MLLWMGGGVGVRVGEAKRERDGLSGGTVQKVGTVFVRTSIALPGCSCRNNMCDWSVYLSMYSIHPLHELGTGNKYTIPNPPSRPRLLFSSSIHSSFSLSSCRAALRCVSSVVSSVGSSLAYSKPNLVRTITRFPASRPCSLSPSTSTLTLRAPRVNQPHLLVRNTIIAQRPNTTIPPSIHTLYSPRPPRRSYLTQVSSTRSNNGSPHSILYNPLLSCRTHAFVLVRLRLRLRLRLSSLPSREHPPTRQP
ncbi:hypothetical protein B0T10DRAFT_217860 [Thelonectria olida]|uniref:Uncharacterized protein n=1 Tax=Thelonectria olida TaxID=1576542 RepID=A0A9P9AT51_9HYPO|nr:hypothetical protein B0T10DRAFT_217860 [Thelonectria olida]